MDEARQAVAAAAEFELAYGDYRSICDALDTMLACLFDSPVAAKIEVVRMAHLYRAVEWSHAVSTFPNFTLKG